MFGDTNPLSTPAVLAPHDPEAIAAVQTQLQSYSDQLGDLYSQRATLIGAREAARLQYVTSWASSVSQTYSQISTQMLNDRATVNQITVINAIYSTIISKILMPDITGTSGPSGWGVEIYNGGVAGGYYFSGYPGVSKVGLLSPIEALISNQNSQGQTVYQLLNTGGQTSDSLNTSVPGNQAYQYATYFPPPASPTDGSNVLSIPISQTYFNYFVTNSYGAGFASSSDYAYMTGLFNKDFGSGSLYTLLDNGHAMLIDLLNQTLNIFKFQGQIQTLESQIQNFITEYQSYGLIDQAVPISDVEASLFQIANTQNAQAALSVAQKSVLPASAAAVPATPTTPSVPSSTSQSSAQSTSLTGLGMKAMGDTVSFLSSPNSVWYALGALAFVVLLKSGKKNSRSRDENEDEDEDEDEDEVVEAKPATPAASAQPESKTNPRRRRRRKARKSKK